MKHILGLVPRSLRKQSRRAALTGLGIALAVALLTAAGVMGASIRQANIDQVVSLGGDYHAQVSGLDARDLAALRAQPGLAATGTSLPLGGHRLDNLFITIEGLDPVARDMLGLELAGGRFPQAEGEIALEGWMLDHLGLERELGQVLSLDFGGSRRDGDGGYRSFTGDADFVLVGILQDITAAKMAGASLGLVTPETALRLLPADFVAYHAFVRVPDSARVHETMAQARAALGLDEGQVSYNERLLQAIGEGHEGSWAVVLLGAVVLVATVATIYNAFHICVLERLREFGLLRAVGATARQLRRQVLAEALILGFLAIPAGLLLGLGGAALLSHSSSLLRELTGRLVVPPPVLLAAAGLGLVATLASALLPALLAGRIPPLEALARNRRVLAGRVQKLPRRWLRLLGASGRMAYENVWRNPRRSLVTIFSLGLGVVLLMVFSTWAASTDAASIAGGMLLGDYALSALTPERGVGFAPEVAAAVAHMPGVKEVYGLQADYGNQALLPTDKIDDHFLEAPDARGEGEWTAVPVTLLGYGDQELELAGPWLTAGEMDAGALAASPSLLLVDPNGETGLTVGDALTLRHYKPGSQGSRVREQTYTVTGILEDVPLMPAFRASGPTAILHREQYAAFTGTNLIKRLDITVEPSADLECLEEQLSALAGSVLHGDLLSYREELAALQSQKAQILTLVYGLVAIVTIIGGVNIVNTISSNLILRTREFGVLRAVGMTGSQLGRMTRLEGLFYGLLGAAWSLPAGGLLSCFFYLVARAEMTYLDLALPWPVAVGAGLGCILVGMAATWLPTRRIARLQVVEALRTIV